MPIGDPMGGETYDLGRGRLTKVSMVAITVPDLDMAVEWYKATLDLEVLTDDRNNGWVEMGFKGDAGIIVLRRQDKKGPSGQGADTGIIFATDSIFEAHRRLVDEGVTFIMKPERNARGTLMAVFLDPFGNRLSITEGLSG